MSVFTAQFFRVIGLEDATTPNNLYADIFDARIFIREYFDAESMPVGDARSRDFGFWGGALTKEEEAYMFPALQAAGGAIYPLASVSKYQNREKGLLLASYQSRDRLSDAQAHASVNGFILNHHAIAKARFDAKLTQFDAGNKLCMMRERFRTPAMSWSIYEKAKTKSPALVTIERIAWVLNMHPREIIHNCQMSMPKWLNHEGGTVCDTFNPSFKG